jgi:hypothetical protein
MQHWHGRGVIASPNLALDPDYRNPRVARMEGGKGGGENCGLYKCRCCLISLQGIGRGVGDHTPPSQSTPRQKVSLLPVDEGHHHTNDPN